MSLEFKRKCSDARPLFRASVVFLLLLSLVTESHAQEVLVIDVNVFGLNQNLSTASEHVQSACTALADDPSAGTADLSSTCQLISNLDPNDPDDVAQLQQILAAIAPEEAFSLNDNVVYASDYQTTNIYSRIHALRTSPSANGQQISRAAVSSGAKSPINNSTILGWFGDGGGNASADLFSKWGLFFSSDFSQGDIDGDLLEQDTETTSSSFTFGTDYRVSEPVLIGLGLGYVQNQSSFTSVTGGTDSEGLNLTLFASWYEEDQAYFDAVLDLGQTNYELQRDISLDASNRVLANADTAAAIVSFTASAGKNVSLHGWSLGGYLRLSLINAEVDAYAETASNVGAGSGSVFRIGAQSITSQTIVAGGELSRAISTGRGVITPVLRLEYENQNRREKENIEAELGNSSVSRAYVGAERDTSYANLGLGASMVFPNGKNAFVFYETHLQHEFVTQNWLKLGFRLEF